MKKEEKVSFEEYIQAILKCKDGKITEEEYKEKLRLFISQNGEILNMYICEHSENVTMLCQKKGKFFSSTKTSFFTQYNLGYIPEIEKLLIKIDFLAAESSRSLRGKALENCLGIIYKVAKNTLGVIDSMEDRKLKSLDEDENLAKTVQVIENNLVHADEYHKKAIKFSTQKDYFLGNIIGFSILAAIFLPILILRSQEIHNLTPEEITMACLIYYGSIGGGIGAIISVMNRVNSGNLQLSNEPDPVSTRIIGIIRPVIGGVFGILILILFHSGFSAFSLIGDELKIMSNFIVLSFIAGFFERFVPDILDKTKNKVLSEEDKISD